MLLNMNNVQFNLLASHPKAEHQQRVQTDSSLLFPSDTSSRRRVHWVCWQVRRVWRRTRKPRPAGWELWPRYPQCRACVPGPFYTGLTGRHCHTSARYTHRERHTHSSGRSGHVHSETFRVICTLLKPLRHARAPSAKTWRIFTEPILSL